MIDYSICLDACSIRDNLIFFNVIFLSIDWNVANYWSEVIIESCFVFKTQDTDNRKHW